MAWLRHCVVASALLAGIVSGVSAEEPSSDGGVCQASVEPAPTDDMQSFAVLRSALKPGHNIWVRSLDGQVTRGKLVSVSDNELVLSRARWFRPDEQRSFRADALEWVLREDSTWNGALIGTGIGVAATALLVSSSDESERGWLVLWPGAEIVVLGAFVGGLIDALHNETVYQRAAERRITLVPVAANHRFGMFASVRF